MNIKLEGSDHAPVYASLVEIPEIAQHSTPSLASRYLPMIRGLQQTLGESFFISLILDLFKSANFDFL